MMIRLLPSFLAAFAAFTTPPSFGAEQVVEQFVRLDVPYVQTPPQVMNAMLDEAKVGKDDLVYDLGSGDGRIVIAAVKERGAKRGVGIDLNPRRIAEANQNAKAAGVADRITFINGDIFKTDFSPATVVTMYLLENVNLRLRPRILDELKPGTRVVSHQFHMFDWAPDRQQLVLGKIPVYFWVVPAKLQGRWMGKAGADTLMLDLTQKFQMVTGTMDAGGASATISLGKITGNSLAVAGTIMRPGGDVKLHFEGTLSGETIAGNLTVDGVATPVALRRN